MNAGRRAFLFVGMADLAHETLAGRLASPDRGGANTRLLGRRRWRQLRGFFQLGRTTVAATSAAEGRPCPNCNESIRRDARPCSHCGNGSEPWIYRHDRWWIRDREQGIWLWLDGSQDKWIPHYYATPPAPLESESRSGTAATGSPAHPREHVAGESLALDEPQVTSAFEGLGDACFDTADLPDLDHAHV
jgi:hypothetical protein